MTVITLVGLGEAGRLYAEGLAEAGVTVKGYDPYVESKSESFTQYTELSEALEGAQVVISLVGAKSAPAVMAQIGPHLKSGMIVADFNTGFPAVKKDLAQVASNAGALFADVAVLAPVPRDGHKTPLMVSGTGSVAFHDLLAPFGLPIEAIGGEAGEAASRKLLRSVFMKGLAAIVIEAVEAAKLVDAEGWIREQIISELGPRGEALIDRLISGSRLHAKRRAHEMSDVMSYLETLETPNWMSTGAYEWLQKLDKENQQEAA